MAQKKVSASFQRFVLVNCVEGSGSVMCHALWCFWPSFPLDSFLIRFIWILTVYYSQTCYTVGTVWRLHDLYRKIESSGMSEHVCRHPFVWLQQTETHRRVWVTLPHQAETNAELSLDPFTQPLPQSHSCSPCGAVPLHSALLWQANRVSQQLMWKTSL